MKNSSDGPADDSKPSSVQSPSAVLSPEEQSDRLAEMLLRSAQRLTTDEKRRLEIKKQLF